MAKGGSMVALSRQLERAAAQRRRELAAQAKVQAAWEEKQRAAYEVSVFENVIECLVSMHKEVGPTWDWREVVARRPSPPPSPTNGFEVQARAAAAAYKPSLFDKWFGGEKKRRAQLDVEIVEGQQRDAQAFAAAQASHARDLQRLAWEQRVADGVLRGDLGAYRTVIDHLAPFAELVESGMSVAVDDLRPEVAVLRCTVNDSAVPRDEKKLTAAGKLTLKAAAAGTYWGVYRDFVCGCALRAAREVFALLPISRVIVNVGTHGIDRSTGHPGYLPILAVSIPRETAEQLRFETLDASDSMQNFPNRVKFKKSSGFELIEPMTADESFITTGTRRR